MNLRDLLERPLSRRSFLRLAAFFGAGLVAGGALFEGGCARLAGDPADIGEEGADRWVYSTCSFCAVGCAVWLGVRGNRVVAVKGVTDSPVNRGMLCVKGIYQYKAIDAPGRARYPLVRREGAWRRVTWEEALELVAGTFRRLIDAHGPDALAIYHSSQILLEEAYVLAKLGRGVIGTRNLDSSSRLCLASAAEGYRLSFGSDGQPASFADVEHADAIMLIGANPAESHPVFFYRLQRTKRARDPFIVLVDPRRTPSARVADVHLAVRPGSDADLIKALINVLIVEGLVDRGFVRAHTTGYAALAEAVRPYTPERVAGSTGIDPARIRRVARAFGRARAGLVAWCAGVNQGAAGTQIVTLINDLCLLTGNVGRPGAGPLSLAGQCASLSVGEAGGSAALPGMRPFADEGARAELARLWAVPAARIPAETRAVTEFPARIEAGEVRALWIIGANPAASMPGADRFRRLLRRLDLVVVQDCYEDTETAALADVILPAAMWAEKDGTFTSAERRVNRVNKAVEPPGEARPDWEICVRVAEKLGAGRHLNFRSSEEIFAEWRRVSAGTLPDMSGMTYGRIERLRGIQWPCPAPSHPGTPRLYVERDFPTPDGRARLGLAEGGGPPAAPDEDYPFWLLTGRVLQHWQTATRTRRVPELALEVGVPYVEISRADAARLGLKEWDPVRVESRHGAVTVRARVTGRVERGQAFLPFHFAELPVNRLLPLAADPASGRPDLKRVAVRIRKLEGDP